MIGKLVVWGPVICKGIPGIQTTKFKNLLSDFYQFCSVTQKSQVVSTHRTGAQTPRWQAIGPLKENPIVE